MDKVNLHVKLPYFKVWKNDRDFVLIHFNVKCINDFSLSPVTGKDYYVLSGDWSTILKWGWDNIIKSADCYPFVLVNYSLYNIENATKIQLVTYDNDSKNLYLNDALINKDKLGITIKSYLDHSYVKPSK